VTCTILGAGFGLYGYLPAMLLCGEHVVLPLRYRSRLEARDDVQGLAEEVEWCTDERHALRLSNTVVLAQRPADQVQRVAECLLSPRISKLLLEKPLAPDPESAAQTMRKLAGSGKRFRIGYAFRYTEWGRALLAWYQAAEPTASVRIEWKFQAHHYVSNVNTWKRRISMGGGALRFYGIHLIALLAELGYDAVMTSRIEADGDDEASGWDAAMIGPGLPDCSIHVDSNCGQHVFAVRSRGRDQQELQISLRDPFADTSGAGVPFDRRVGVLVHLCRDLLFGDQVSYPWYQATIDLWRQAENGTI
jgi:predicted dehydrogenase